MYSTESKPPSASGTSGKLLIIVILTVAFIAAGTSWWFRYSATHRVAAFWGPAAPVIRDAAVVEFWLPVNFHPELRDAALLVDDSELRDISSAHGLVHLRNALLEDHSFNWPPAKIAPDVEWTQGLRFLDGSTGVLVMFSRDFKFVRTPNGEEMLSCEPIAKGLREMFAEFTSAASANDGAKPQAAGDAAVQDKSPAAEPAR